MSYLNRLLSFDYHWQQCEKYRHKRIVVMHPSCVYDIYPTLRRVKSDLSLYSLWDSHSYYLHGVRLTEENNTFGRQLIAVYSSWFGFRNAKPNTWRVYFDISTDGVRTTHMTRTILPLLCLHTLFESKCRNFISTKYSLVTLPIRETNTVHVSTTSFLKSRNTHCDFPYDVLKRITILLGRFSDGSIKLCDSRKFLALHTIIL